MKQIPKNLYNGFIYEWINLVNNKRYIGSHWGHEDDGYIGSGVLFKKALEKYGIDNFKRVILEFKNYESEKALRKTETFYLQKLKVVEKELYYNLTDNAGCSIRTLESRTKQSKTMTGRKQFKETVYKRVSKMRNENHPQFKGHYVTPAGTFCSSLKAAKSNDVSYRTVLNKCKMNKNGWYFNPKEK